MSAAISWIVKTLGLDSLKAWIIGGALAAAAGAYALIAWQGHQISNLKENLSTAQETARIAISAKEELQVRAQADINARAAARDEQLKRDKIAKESIHEIMSAPAGNYGPISNGLRRTLEQLQ